MRYLLFITLFLSSNLLAGTYWSVVPAFGGYTGESAESVCSQIQQIHPSGTILHPPNICELIGFTTISLAFNTGTCPSPLVENGTGQCVEPDPCDYGASAGDGWGRDDEYLHKSCNGTCEIWASTCDYSTTIVINGVDVLFNHCFYTYGNECSISNQPSSSPTEPDNTNESCAAGQTIGTFNGSTVCVNSATGEAESTEPPAESSETESSTTTPPNDNGDGTSTTTTITSNTTVTNGTTSTTTTTTTTTTDNSTGDVVGQTTDSTITEHPNAPKPSDDAAEEGEESESTYTANDCLSPIACTGDAIQCALAQQTKDTACLLTSPDPSDVTAQNLGVPVEHQTIEESTEYDLTNDIDTSSFLADSCPADRTLNYSIAGQSNSFTIEYAPICEIADIVGDFVLIASAILSIRIVGGGF